MNNKRLVFSLTSQVVYFALHLTNDIWNLIDTCFCVQWLIWKETNYNSKTVSYLHFLLWETFIDISLGFLYPPSSGIASCVGTAGTVCDAYTFVVGDIYCFFMGSRGHIWIIINHEHHSVPRPTFGELSRQLRTSLQCITSKWGILITQSKGHEPIAVWSAGY